MSTQREKERRVDQKAISFRNRRRFDRRMNIEEFKKIIFAARKDTPPEERRIVITGIGVVAPNGTGKDRFWDALAHGESGIRPITLFETASYASKRAGEITDFDPARYLGRKGLRTLDRSTLLLAVATTLAMRDAQMEIDNINTYDTGIVTGTSMGSVKSISDFDKSSLIEGPSSVNPALFPNTVINAPSSQVSILFDIRGLNATISSGFCSALDAAIYAYDAILLNKVNTIFAGSVEELCHQTFLGFYKAGCLSMGDDKDTAAEESMPFDRRRNGLVLAEGAGTLILEDLAHARERNAHIYGEILGFGRAFDPDAPVAGYNPNAEGAVRAMNKALESAHLKPGEIDLICASANSSPAGDEVETIAIKKAFGNHARAIPISAIKAMTGEGYSTSGSLQIMAALLSLNRGIIPPTINYQVKDPRCDLDYVPNESRTSKINKVMVNSFSPHGNNVSLIIGRYHE